MPVAVDLTFSPERAARGELVQMRRLDINDWQDVHFVGLCKTGQPVIQIRSDGGVFACVSNALRMKPMPTKKWVLEFPSEAAANWAQNNLFINGRFGNVGYAIPPIKEVVIPAEDA